MYNVIYFGSYCFRLNLLHINTVIDRSVFVGGNAHERVEIGSEIRSCPHVVVFDFYSNS